MFTLKQYTWYEVQDEFNGWKWNDCDEIADFILSSMNYTVMYAIVSLSSIMIQVHHTTQDSTMQTKEGIDLSYMLE